MPTSIKKSVESKSLSSADSKVLVRQVLRTMDDTYHPHPPPTLPSTAIIKGDAKGIKETGLAFTATANSQSPFTLRVPSTQVV